MPTDSRRKHRRSPSPDDQDKSSKRHKHRHRHRHHSSKKRDEEEIQFDAETVDSVKINYLPVDDVEEGEILDDEPIEVKDDSDLRSNDKNPVWYDPIELVYVFIIIIFCLISIFCNATCDFCLVAEKEQRGREIEFNSR